MSFRELRERLAQVVGRGDPPHVVAFSWACGVAISLSPLLGLHTLLALLLAFAFRLNKVDVLLGTLVVNPWTLAPYSVLAVSVGQAVTGRKVHLVTPIPHLPELFDPSFWHAQEPAVAALLVNWAVGAGVLSILGGVAVYGAVRFALSRRRRSLAPGA
ncbi:MAG: DUF2062 domain-containing protein [Thermoanaerobaculum sp.]